MTPAARPENPSPGTQRLYLRQFDLYRCLAFLGVVGQHAVLWPVPPSSIGGFGAVMLLHFTRNAFFFASALVLCHSWLRAAGPGRSPGTGRAPAGWWWRFWRRRVATVLVPYLVWTVAYSLYSIATTSGGAALWPVLRHNLVNGYYQLYFVVVLVQLYVVLPLLVALLRRTVGHHGVVLAVSAAVQLILDGLQHSVHGSAGVAGTAHAVAVSALASRYLPAYQLFVVAGALTVWHLDTVFTVIDRHWRRLLVAVAVVGLAAEGRYLAAALTAGHPGRASDLNQPIAGGWVLAALVGPAGRIYAVDSDPRARDEVAAAAAAAGEAQVVAITQAGEDLLLPEPVDLAFCRFLLLHVDEPATVLARMAATVRPGGYVVAQEPITSAGRIEGRPLSMPGARRPDIGALLPRLVRDAGLQLLDAWAEAPAGSGPGPVATYLETLTEVDPGDDAIVLPPLVTVIARRGTAASSANQPSATCCRRQRSSSSTTRTVCGSAKSAPGSLKAKWPFSPMPIKPSTGGWRRHSAP